MAIPAEPATDALYQDLSSPEPDPKVVHAAIEEVRQIASQNVIAVLGAKIDSQGARIDVKFSQIKAQIAEVKAEIGAQGARIDDLRQVIWRVIWPLIVLLAVPIFGLLYKTLTS